MSINLSNQLILKVFMIIRFRFFLFVFTSLIFFFSLHLAGQIFIPLGFYKSNEPLSVNPSNPIYILAGDSIVLTTIGGMGLYDWSITGTAAGDGAAITYTQSNPSADYNARLSSYATDTITVSSPGYTDITLSTITYDALSISPLTATVGIRFTQAFTTTGKYLNDTNYIKKTYTFSITSKTKSINTSNIYTTPNTINTKTIQISNSIKNTTTTTITIINDLTISPTNLKLAVYSSHIFNTILKTLPYTFTINSGTGSTKYRSSLNNAANSSDTTLNVTTTTGCPNVGSVRINSKTICYNSLTTTTFTELNRGCNNNTASNHANSTPYNNLQIIYTTPTMIDTATIQINNIETDTNSTTIALIKPTNIQTKQYHTYTLYDEGSIKY